MAANPSNDGYSSATEEPPSLKTTNKSNTTTTTTTTLKAKGPASSSSSTPVVSSISLQQPAPAGGVDNVRMSALARLRSASISAQPDYPEQVEVFVTPPSSALICPIHLGLIEQPRIARCGHTFCLSCITESLQHNKVCPLDYSELSLDVLVPNLALDGQLDDLVVYCKYGVRPADDWHNLPQDQQWVPDEDGCPAQLKRSEVAHHVASCPYKKIECPNSSACGLIPRNKFEQHMLTCENVPCRNQEVGCPVKGTAEFIEKHLANCKFESMKDVLAHTRNEFALIRASMEQKDKRIELLTESVTELSQKLEYLADNVECQLATYDMTLSKLTQGIHSSQRTLAELSEELQILKQRAPEGDMDRVYLHMFTCKGNISGHGGPIWAIVEWGPFVFSASSDMTIKVWELQQGIYSCAATLEGHNGIVHALVVKNSMLFSGSSDSTIMVWDLEKSFERVHTIQAHDNDICTLAVSDQYLLSCSLKEIKVWDLDTYQCTHILSGHNHWVRALAVHGTRLYSGSYNMIKVWDLEDLQCIQTVTGQDGSVYSLCVHGKNLFSGTYENTVQIWDLETLQIRETLSGHLGTVYALSVDPLHNYLFSGSYDNTVKVWNLETLHCVQTLVRHTSSVDALCWTSKGTLFSGGADHNIKVWK